LGLREARTREPRGRLSSRRAGRRSPAAAAALPGSVAGGSAGGGRRRLCLLWAPCGYYPGRAPHIVISIVIPVFDSGDVMIRECHAAIAAVLAAIAEPAEILFVDDGSRDGTLEAVKAVQRGDSRVRIVEPAPHFGVAAAG